MSEVNDVKPLQPTWPVTRIKRRQQNKRDPADSEPERKPARDEQPADAERQPNPEHIDEYA